MFAITLSKEDIDEFANRFSNEKKARIRQGLALVRQEWQQEFRRQDERNQKSWTPLKTWVDTKIYSGEGGAFSSVGGTDPKSYAARKRRAYFSGKSRGGNVKYLRILKRTGVMLDRYISGISINNTSMTVSINFPTGRTGKAAMSHQGRDRQGNAVGLPKGVLAHRPYDVNRFELVANRILRRELYKD